MRRTRLLGIQQPSPRSTTFQHDLPLRRIDAPHEVLPMWIGRCPLTSTTTSFVNGS